MIAIILLDQFTKNLAIKHLKYKGLKQGKFLKLYYVENYGAAMGFLKNKPIILKSVSIILLCIVTYIMVHGYITGESVLRTWSLALVIGGGIGNMLDRFTRGYVVDFYSFNIKKLPYFNIADFFIILGCILLVITEFNV